MINYIWFGIIFIGTIFGITTGKIEEVSKAVVNSTSSTVEFMITFVGMMCLWCGVMKIAEKSGLTDKIAKVLTPIMKLIFKDAVKNDKALGAMVMNITSNMLGLSNAATPFGIKAMEELEKDNKNKGVATNDMALFLVLNTAAIQLIPTSVISIRAACGSANPAIIIGPAIVATGSAAIMGVIYCKILQRYF
ncbi:spore maturation protein [Clostridium bornimense]|uniref:nucleoside recognition domain-containing protein n=1 Tax=Clostridium bornimense TaxID=1216932 RepID=UPI001C10A8FF|nr:nucleoside recognition domain-containing protein [Clostridium bornimense]MBU5315760.1 spore maturation protein [Clostridium bornimense]